MPRKTHGLSKSKEYRTWKDMRRRCNNPDYIEFHNYGGRGIKVCQQWNNSFKAFLEDMGFRPTPKHTIERIDNDLGYFAENCYWATPLQQAQNTRVNKNITFKGKTLCQREWSRRLGGSHTLVYGRLKRGWSIHKIFSTPIKQTYNI